MRMTHGVSMMKAGRATCAALMLTFGGWTALDAMQAPPAGPPQAPPAGAVPPGPGRGGGRGPAVKSPEVAADGRVTFRLRAPAAKEVLVNVGGKRLPLEKNDQGIWTATSDVLAPDYYTYSLIVDGTTINDPANRQMQTSFGSYQSMFVVPGPQPWLPAPGVPRGAIARHVFHSAVANDDRDFFVYTPPGYDAKRAQAYPVVFLLHGLGDDAERWVNTGGANVILDNLIAQGKAVPMVMVTTLGYGVNNGPAGAMAPENITGYTKILHRRSDADGREDLQRQQERASSTRSPDCRWAAPKRSTPPSTISTSSRGSGRSAARS